MFQLTHSKNQRLETSNQLRETISKQFNILKVS